MLVIKIELWPGGRESHKRELSRAHIIRDKGIGQDATIGDYDVLIWRKGTIVASSRQEKGLWKTGRVVGFPRKRFNAWWLLRQALLNCLEYR